MLMYSDYFTNISAGNSFFAGANTSEGFVADYGELLSEDTFEKIYIIKGGSGTGKSTLIRKCAKTGENCHANITYILCSSDPDSLDGIIIEKDGKKIAVIDGTAPHVKDPEYAGACGEIVNFGDHWDSSILEGNKAAIAELIKEKKMSFKRAYTYLSAAGEIVEMQEGIAGQCLDRKKMEKAISRMISNIGLNKSGSKGKISYRRTCGITMKGMIRLSTFECCKTVFGICDCSFISLLFYNALLKALRDYGLDVEVSVSPLGGICEIRIPMYETAFVPKNEGIVYDKIINLRRFAKKEELAKTKERRIFSGKCLSAMLEGACESMSKVKDLHFSLEKIYFSAMDFEGIDELCEGLCKDIKKRLSPT